MNGYAVSGRIERVRPRIVVWAGLEHDSNGRPTGSDPPPSFPADVDLADTAVDDDLVDRLEAFRDRWTQLTFYLFDPESWR